VTEIVRNLEEVLDDIVASGESPERAGTHRWVDEYPEYAAQIMEFLASWTIMRAASAPHPAVRPSEATQTLRGMSIVQNLMHEHVRSLDADASPLRALAKRAQALGMDSRALAGALDLGEVVLRKLDRRLIRFATIPRLITVRLAEVLQTTEAAVVTYFQLPPTLSTEGRFHSSKAPSIPKSESFSDAVRTDNTMTDQQRARWTAGAGDDNRGDKPS